MSLNTVRLGLSGETACSRHVLQHAYAPVAFSPHIAAVEPTFGASAMENLTTIFEVLGSVSRIFKSLFGNRRFGQNVQSDEERHTRHAKQLAADLNIHTRADLTNRLGLPTDISDDELVEATVNKAFGLLGARLGLPSDASRAEIGKKLAGMNHSEIDKLFATG